MAKHAVVRTDKLLGTQGFPQIASFRFFATVNSKEAPAEIENGNVVDISAGLLTDGAQQPKIINREEYKAVAPTASTKLKDILLVKYLFHVQCMQVVEVYLSRYTCFNASECPSAGVHFHLADKGRIVAVLGAVVQQIAFVDKAVSCCGYTVGEEKIVINSGTLGKRTDKGCAAH